MENDTSYIHCKNIIYSEIYKEHFVFNGEYRVPKMKEFYFHAICNKNKDRIRKSSGKAVNFYPILRKATVAEKNKGERLKNINTYNNPAFKTDNITKELYSRLVHLISEYDLDFNDAVDIEDFLGGLRKSEENENIGLDSYFQKNPFDPFDPTKEDIAINKNSIESLVFDGQNFIPKSEYDQKKENIMLKSIKTQTLINERVVSSYNKEEMIDIIIETEKEINRLDSMETESTIVTNKIKELKDLCVKAAKLIDDEEVK